MSGTALLYGWPPLPSYAAILPVGCLWGVGLALCSPAHPTIEIVTILVFLVTGSVIALAFKPVLQAANFHYVATLLALFCVAHGTFSYTRPLNLTDTKTPLNEVVSELKNYAAMTACLSSALIMAHPPPARDRQADNIEIGKPDQLSLDPSNSVPSVNPSRRDSWDVHSQTSEIYPDDTNSVMFQCLGPSSTYSGNTDSSDISLSSHGQVKPEFATKVVQLTQMVYPIESDRDGDGSTKPQIDLD